MKRMQDVYGSKRKALILSQLRVHQLYRSSLPRRPSVMFLPLRRSIVRMCMRMRMAVIPAFCRKQRMAGDTTSDGAPSSFSFSSSFPLPSSGRVLVSPREPHGQRASFSVGGHHLVAHPVGEEEHEAILQRLHIHRSRHRVDGRSRRVPLYFPGCHIWCRPGCCHGCCWHCCCCRVRC